MNDVLVQTAGLPTTQRLVLGIQYEGSDFAGWQSQTHGKTIQDCLQAALFEFAKTPIPVVCAGRTDAGVHALRQVVHLDTELDRPLASWVRGVNRYLPPSISVQWARQVSQDFHARFSAHTRSYVYLLQTSATRSPILFQRSGWIHADLNLLSMQQATQVLVGEHDFSSFRSAECQAKSPVKTMYNVQIAQCDGMFIFYFSANAFLHHMIRNLVGALIYIGQGKQAPAWMTELLAARSRLIAAPTFMPDGLYLTGIQYPERFDLPFNHWQEPTEAGLSAWVGQQFFARSPSS